GIKQRHIAADGELTSDLAVQAAERALACAEIDPAEVDAIVLATTTPDETFPATATRVQARLGLTGGFAFDVQAVCSGFVYELRNQAAAHCGGWRTDLRSGGPSGGARSRLRGNRSGRG